MRERFKRMLCLVLSLTAAVGLMLVRDSAAWFNTNTGSPIGQTLDVKTLNFTFKGELDSYLAYPEQGGSSTPFVITDRNLIDGYTESGSHYIKLSGVNYSTVDTVVRFKIFYSHPSTGALTAYGSANNIMTATAAPGWEEADGYFTRSFSSATSAGEAFDLLTDLRFSEEAAAEANITSASSSFDGKIVIGIQARQADNMVWADIGEITSSSAFVANATTTTTQAP